MASLDLDVWVLHDLVSYRMSLVESYASCACNDDFILSLNSIYCIFKSDEDLCLVSKVVKFSHLFYV